MISKILDRLFVVAGALLFLQLPLFMYQYQLQLTGHVNELHWQVQSMQKTAQQTGKSLEQYIQKFVSESDQDFASQGFVMKKVYVRHETLSHTLEKLQAANYIIKPFLFVYYAQWDIAKSTLHLFEPGLTFSSEALIYALLGMLIGYFTFMIVRKFTHLIACAIK